MHIKFKWYQVSSNTTPKYSEVNFYFGSYKGRSPKIGDLAAHPLPSSFHPSVDSPSLSTPLPWSSSHPGIPLQRKISHPSLHCPSLSMLKFISPEPREHSLTKRTFRGEKRVLNKRLDDFFLSMVTIVAPIYKGHIKWQHLWQRRLIVVWKNAYDIW